MPKLKPDNYIAQRLKIARQAAELSLRAAGEKIGISAQAISQHERGKTNPNGTRLLQFAKAYGVKVEFFFRGKPLKIEIIHVCKRRKGSVR